MTTKTITPDPKPTTKRRTGTTPAGNPIVSDDAPKAKRLTKAQKDAAIDKIATEIEEKPTVVAAAMFGSGQSIAQIALAIEKSHATVRELLTEAGVDFSADKNAVDIKDKVRTASAATLARRAANEADKAKVKAEKSDDAKKRAEAREHLQAFVVKTYGELGTVKATAAATVNPSTGKPYSNTRIMRILAEAGVLTVTKRGDTSERDAAIVTAFEADSTVEQIATDYKLSAARVRSILKKGGKELAGGTRGSKLPELGSAEWNEFANDVAALCEKWGSALGTMAHAMRRAGSAAGS